MGNTTILSSTTPLGTWSSNNGNATVNPSTGEVNGVTAGTSTITYSITDGNGCTGIATTLVTVNGPPAQPSVISGSTTPCSEMPGLNYSVTNISGLTYTWTVPSGWTIISGQGTNQIQVTSGYGGDNGNISVIATNSCGPSVARTLGVTVSLTNNIGFGTIAGQDTTVNTQTICSGTSTTIVGGGNPSGGQTFQWQVSSNPGGPFATVATNSGDEDWTVSATYYNTPGTYYFRRVITGNGVCNGNSDVVTLIVEQAATADAGPPTQLVCASSPNVSLAGVIGGSVTGGTWSSNGSGSFAPDVNTLNAVYTLSPADIFSGYCYINPDIR